MAASLRVCLLIALAVLAGCSRRHYRERADVDAYSLLHEKAGHTPWDVPDDYDVVAAPGSRLFDPTPLENPLLPIPAPQLYAYVLPQLPQRDPARFQQRLRTNNLGIEENLFPQVQVASHATTFRRLPDVSRQVSELPSSGKLRPVAYLDPRAQDAASPNVVNPELPAPEDESPLELEEGQLRVAPIPASAWEDIPQSCKIRMFEFESIREEFKQTYGQLPGDERRGAAQALALEDIVELALLNSREYQTQKETLYRTALALSLQRFAYDLKFTTGGNRIETDYTHQRGGGNTITNELSVPNGYQVDKMLATGGTVVLALANRLVLNFNTANGIATEVGSDIVLDIEQTLLQIDVQFESLTQAERDLVYAARNFARSRKTLYTTLTSQYYDLIFNYRRVEIASQNYVTLARVFRQSELEYRANQTTRVQVDQIEQNLLRDRNALIETCNSLEQAFDDLKIRIGLPTETPINIDLTELEQLTRHDELAVRRQLVRRAQNRLIDERNVAEPQRVVLLSSAVDLIERMLGTFDVMRQLGEAPPDEEALRDLQARLAVQLARTDANLVRGELEQILANDPPNYPLLFGRSIELVDKLLTLIDRQIELATLRGASDQAIADIRRTAAELHERKDRLDEADDRLIEQLKGSPDETNDEFDDERFLEELRRLVDEVTALRQAGEEFIQLLDRITALVDAPRDPAEALAETIRVMDDLVAQTNQILSSIGGGLAPIEMEFDDAMLTALVLRLDLMNQRGALADDWRQIKLAADDLKSVLNLRASQTVRRAGVTPFDFTFDESLTQLNATLDLPLNRRAQRNTFRQNLINYQAALRQLMQLEDTIKLSVRNDLRALALDQEQYQVDVASAALAFERVVTTQLERRLGLTGGVQARDFLEAQTSYVLALSNVARRHTSYIVDRMQLFLDTELLTVNEQGLWDGLYNESVQPTPYYQLPPHAFPFYGELPRGLHYSSEMRRMEQVPPGTSMIHRDPTADELQPVPEDIDLPNVGPAY